jgi:hypothetical protein
MKLFWKKSERQETRAMPSLIVEPTGASDFGPCPCCGDNSRSVWGIVHVPEADEGAYFVQWTLGQVPRHGAHFDLILGHWGDGTGSSDRFAVSLEFRRTEQGPWFMVIDANEREICRNELVGRGLRREEVIGTPLAKRAFDIVDAIWQQDERIREVRGDAG